jgi:hypothetical protein
MTDMVERVARAIYEDRNGPRCEPWGTKPKGHKDPYRADARAAIEAMREPTEAMVGSGADHDAEGGGTGNPLAIYTAMIDAALSPNQKG